ncbi:hypothetical protein KKB83_04490 [Patescibacteria group bacterium]|nr:hypothetical protein [Patescibacteria group bacterium]
MRKLFNFALVCVVIFLVIQVGWFIIDGYSPAYDLITTGRAAYQEYRSPDPAKMRQLGNVYMESYLEEENGPVAAVAETLRTPPTASAQERGENTITTEVVEAYRHYILKYVWMMINDVLAGVFISVSSSCILGFLGRLSRSHRGQAAA